MIERNDKEIREMGPVLDSQERKNDLIYGIINSFTKKYGESLDGKDIERCTTELLGGSMIRAIFKRFYFETIRNIEALQDISEYEIRIAVMNATGVRGVMFVSEVAFEILVKDIIASKLKFPCVECLFAVKEELQKILANIYIPDFLRFGRLKEFFITMGNEVIDMYAPAAENNILAIIEIESSFLNISHPDFIKPTEAMLIAETSLEEAAKRPKIDRNKPVEPKNSEGPGWIQSIFSSNKNEEVKKFEEVGNGKDGNLKNVLDEEMTPKEQQEILLIKILIDNYFAIVKMNVGDSVPKAIMRNLVNKTREMMPRVLTSRMYNNEQLYEMLLDEDPQVKARRKYCGELKLCLAQAFDILKDVIG